MIAALVVGGIAVAIKVASSRRQVSGKKAEREVREPDAPAVQQAAAAGRRRARLDSVPAAVPTRRPDVDDELARLKREMGG